MFKNKLMESKPSTFSITTWDSTVSITEPNSDFNIYEWIDILRKLTIASGFSEKTWRRAIIELSLGYEKE